MASYSFKPRFAAMVEAGDKRQTIRRPRRGRYRHARPGERVQLIAEIGLSERRRLMTPDPICERCDPVAISADGVEIGGAPLPAGDLDDFAWRDGFEDFAEMRAWLQDAYGPLPFVGLLVVWKPFVGGSSALKYAIGGRWTPARKEAVLNDVLAGRATLEAVRREHGFSAEELAVMLERHEQKGRLALRTTRVQHHRRKGL